MKALRQLLTVATDWSRTSPSVQNYSLLLELCSFPQHSTKIWTAVLNWLTWEVYSQIQAVLQNDKLQRKPVNHIYCHLCQDYYTNTEAVNSWWSKCTEKITMVIWGFKIFLHHISKVDQLQVNSQISSFQSTTRSFRVVLIQHCHTQIYTLSSHTSYLHYPQCYAAAHLMGGQVLHSFSTHAAWLPQT